MAKIKLKLWFRKLTVKTSPSSSSTQCHLPFSSRSNCGSACVNELQEVPCAENGVLQLSNPNNGNSTPNPNNTATPNPNNIATVTRNPIIVSSNHLENTVRNPNSLNEAAIRPRSRFHEVNMSTVQCGCSHYSSRFASSFRKSTQDILASSCKGRSSDPIPPAIASNDGLQSPAELEGNRGGEDHRNRRTRISSNRRTKKRVSRRTSDSTSQETNDVIQNKELENGVLIACSKTCPHQSAYYHPCGKGSYNGVDEVHGNCVENSTPHYTHRALTKDKGYRKAHETQMRDYFCSVAVTSDDLLSYGDRNQQSFSSNSSWECMSHSRLRHKKNRHHVLELESSVDGGSSRSFRDIQVDNVHYVNAKENAPLPNGKRTDDSNYLVRIKEEYELDDKFVVRIEDDSSSFSNSHHGRSGLRYVTGVRLRQTNHAVSQTGLKLRRKSTVVDGEEVPVHEHKQDDDDICPTSNVSSEANDFGKEECNSHNTSIAQGAVIRKWNRRRRSSRKSERQQEFFVSIGEDLGGVGDPISGGHMVSPSCKFDSTYGLIMSHGMIDADNGIVDASSAHYNDGHANGIKDDGDHANGNNNSNNNNNNRGDGDYCDTSCFDDDKGIVAMKSGRDGNGNSGGCVAVMKCSNDPVADFHGSMIDVIMAAAEEDEEEEEEWWRRCRVLLTASDMEALLLCYLSLNSQEHHHAIVTAFTQVWKEVFANDEDLS